MVYQTASAQTLGRGEVCVLEGQFNMVGLERHILLSRSLIDLFDMIIKLQGHEVAYAYDWLANAYGISTNEPITRTLDEDQKLTLSEALLKTAEACKPDRLDLPVTLAHLPRVQEATRTARTYADVQSPVGELRSRMHDELKSKLFLYVPPIEASFYAVNQSFGAEVESKFPDTASDIEESGDCIALGRSTAAVFHLMRVMERIVQAFGVKLGVVNAAEKNWQNILDELDKRIKNLSDSTVVDKAVRDQYALATANLFSVKLAWRNPVMHPKSSYSAEEAVEIYASVKAFVKHMATIL